MDIYRCHKLSDPSYWDLRGPELYAIWHSKVFWLYLATKLNPFKSKYFLWIDAGVFRDKASMFNWIEWPDMNEIEKLFGDNRDIYEDFMLNPNEHENHIRPTLRRRRLTLRRSHHLIDDENITEGGSRGTKKEKRRLLPTKALAQVKKERRKIRENNNNNMAQN